MRGYFTVGSDISWTQYVNKFDTKGTVRTGVVWSDAPSFENEFGAFVWVIPDSPYFGENSAIAVRVHRSGRDQGTAVLYEDSLSYTQHSREAVNSDGRR